MRIDWRKYALWLAWTASQRSEARATTAQGEDSSRKNGACVLAKTTNRVLALGYNGFPPGFKPPLDFYKDRLKRVTHIIHAETNALVHVAREEAQLIAVTQAPCATCAQQIVARGIPLVVYGEYDKDGAGIDILHFYGVELVYFPILRLLTEWVTPAIGEYVTRAEHDPTLVNLAENPNT